VASPVAWEQAAWPEYSRALAPHGQDAEDVSNIAQQGGTVNSHDCDKTDRPPGALRWWPVAFSRQTIPWAILF